MVTSYMLSNLSGKHQYTIPYCHIACKTWL